MPLPESFLKDLAKIVGRDRCLTRPEERIPYATDATGREGLPGAVAFAATTDEVSRIMALCHERRVPVTPRGAGTGMTGGSIALNEGVALVLSGMDKILEIDTENLIARVEPGVITGKFQAAVEAKGLFYPPDPGSAAYSTMGGNAAECAGGPRAVKYGVTRDYVLGLTAVIPGGAVIRTGVVTAKGVVGYDLTRLLVGSEGTLAVITGLTVRLLPLPAAVRTLCAVYDDIRDAARTVAALFGAGIICRAVEYMDRAALACAETHLKTGLPTDAGAVLLLEVDGDPDSADAQAKAAAAVCEKTGAKRVIPADNKEEAALLWKARKSLSPAMFALGPNKLNEDIVVPRTKIPDMISKIEEIRKRDGLSLVTFGHAGDGNMHVNVMYDKADAALSVKAEKAVDEIFDYTLALGGTLSGEHGVGLTKAPWLSKEIGPAEMALMKGIKALFDPNNIMNPGKIF